MVGIKSKGWIMMWMKFIPTPEEGAPICRRCPRIRDPGVRHGTSTNFFLKFSSTSWTFFEYEDHPEGGVSKLPCDISKVRESGLIRSEYHSFSSDSLLEMLLGCYGTMTRRVDWITADLVVTVTKWGSVVSNFLLDPGEKPTKQGYRL